ncbi:hypothetical protein CRENBAI_015115 [Crenichthys baileyi]|uniref:Uncharacterized protein n=1 Tax=Crenichthys baileyi TaxID=28760 RepID=A0AAV9SJN9_9TELE
MGAFQESSKHPAPRNLNWSRKMLSCPMSQLLQIRSLLFQRMCPRAMEGGLELCLAFSRELCCRCRMWIERTQKSLQLCSHTSKISTPTCTSWRYSSRPLPDYMKGAILGPLPAVSWTNVLLIGPVFSRVLPFCCCTTVQAGNPGGSCSLVGVTAMRGPVGDFSTSLTTAFTRASDPGDGAGGPEEAQLPLVTSAAVALPPTRPPRWPNVKSLKLQDRWEGWFLGMMLWENSLIHPLVPASLPD